RQRQSAGNWVKLPNGSATEIVRPLPKTQLCHGQPLDRATVVRAELAPRGFLCQLNWNRTCTHERKRPSFGAAAKTVHLPSITSSKTTPISKLPSSLPALAKRTIASPCTESVAR